MKKNYPSNYFEKIQALMIWSIIFASQLIAVGLLSWHLLAQIDFAYPVGYKLLGLDKNIAEFAPLNHYKHQFELTTPQDHWHFFAQITKAIQHHGEGLENISYKLPDGNTTPLMHSAEIIHLQDVSHLVDIFYSTGYTAIVVWFIFLGIAYLKNYAFPAIKNIIIGFCSALTALVIIILCMGPTHVFYGFHTKIFPNGHQWFFYYEDSLMTTLMKAPDIFAFIAVLLLGVLVIIWCVTTYISMYFFNRKIPASVQQDLRKAKSGKIKFQKNKNNK